MENLNIVGHNTKGDRIENDFYPTPSIATLKLLEKEKFEGDIWECACGDGAISKILTSQGHFVFNSDIIDRGFNDETINFLETNRKIKSLRKQNTKLKDEVSSLWSMLDELQEADIKNWGHLMKELEEKEVFEKMMTTAKKADC